MIKLGLSENHELFKELYEINLKLWNFQDWQRCFFKLKDDNSHSNEVFKRLSLKEFIIIRDEPITNDKRAKVKKKINNLTKSIIIEEKKFTNYEI